MPSIPIHPLPPSSSSRPAETNPLPSLLHTPSGLALLELQGTINMPEPDLSLSDGHDTPIGRLVFPDYSPSDPADSTAWMKRVHLYVGKHQRLTGEVKKLPNPMALIQRRGGNGEDMEVDGGGEELEIVELVRWKILFSSRPEPVGS